MERSPLLGILGGLGPMSSVYFYEMLTEHTAAECDQDHLNIVISSHASTPDRTAYILGNSDENPLDVMIEDVKRLEKYGADVIAIPCNTAHYFYNELKKETDVPILNIIEETVDVAYRSGTECIGVLATDGTVRTESYQKVCAKHGIRCEVPCEKEQAWLMDIIYKDIKSGKRADMEKFSEICRSLEARGCRRLVLGCTELSLIKRNEHLGDIFLDSLEALAYRTIMKCGKTAIGFPTYFNAK